MTVKSIVDIDVSDEAFKAFKSLYDKYTDELKKAPDEWAKVAKLSMMSALAIEQARDAKAKANREAEEERKREETERRKAEEEERRRLQRWRDLGTSSKQFLVNLRDATAFMLRWLGPLGIAGGLLGGGGLYGLDRLAIGASNSRRSALGLGTTIGEQQAFETNLGRVVDPRGFLSGVSEALADVTKRYTLFGAGMNEGQIGGRDTAQVSIALLSNLKRIADQTDPRMLAQVIQARGLSQFVTVEDMRRLRSTSQQELSQYLRDFQRNAAALNINDETARQWQDFRVQLSTAGRTIEAAFIRGLTPLIPKLTQLSGAFSAAVESLLKSPQIAHWIDELGDGLGRAAKYIASAKFEQDVKTFVEDIGKLGAAMDWLVNHIPGAARVGAGAVVGGTIGFAAGGPIGAVIGAGAGGVVGGAHGVASGQPSLEKNAITRGAFGAAGWLFDALGMNGPAARGGANNPGNLRMPGSKTGFAAFGSETEGLLAMARQLVRDQYVHGLQTLRQLIGDERWGYAPSSDRNNVAAYVGGVSRETGIAPDRPLNLSNPEELARVMAAMLHRENSKNKQTPSMVLKVINNTGGNAVVSASLLPK